MKPHSQMIYDYFLKLHHEAAEAVKGLPQNALDWSPGDGVNSIAALIVHLTAAERFWIGDVALNEPSERDRDAEFEAGGLTVDELLEKLKASEDYLVDALSKFELADLEAVRRSPRTGKEITVGYCLAHTLSHTALHVGHLQLMRSMIETRSTRI